MTLKIVSAAVAQHVGRKGVKFGLWIRMKRMGGSNPGGVIFYLLN
jgi:hypothetical protein